MSHLYRNNWFAISLLLTGALLAIITVIGYMFNPNLFSSFSWMVFGFISSIAVYMCYNIMKIAREMKKIKD